MIEAAVPVHGSLFTHMETGHSVLRDASEPGIINAFWEETKYDVPQDVSKSGSCSKSGCREEVYDG